MSTRREPRREEDDGGVDSLAVVEKEVVVSSCCATGNPRLDNEPGRILDVPTRSRPSCAMRLRVALLLFFVVGWGRYVRVLGGESSRMDRKGMRW